MIELVIWDLDGTLIDSLPATFAAFNAGIRPFLGKELSPQELMTHFGPSEIEILRQLVGEKNAPEAYRLMMESMQSGLDQIKVFDGIREALERLTDQDRMLGIFTGSGRERTDVILDRVDLAQYFDAIVTSSDIEKSKPSPEGVLKACKELGVNPKNALMVGDSIKDVQAATSAGALSAGCTWDGRSTLETFQDANPNWIFSRPEEAIQVVSAANSKVPVSSR